MPDPNLSSAIQEAYANVPTDQVILHTLSLYHPTWKDTDNTPKALYFVQDHQALYAYIENGASIDSDTKVTFLPTAFSLELPKVDLLPVPEIFITIDNIGGQLIPYLEQAASDVHKITLTYRPYLSSDLSGPQMKPPLSLTLSEIQVTTLHIRAKARMADMGNRPFPAEEYTLKNFPTLANF